MKHYFKRELKKYNNKQMKTLNDASELFMELTKRTNFSGVEQYGENRNYLSDMYLHFRKNKEISSLIGMLLSKIDTDLEVYLVNLKKMYPECYEIIDGHLNGSFCFACAESKYLKNISTLHKYKGE